jgi:hypothetical protein
MPAPKGNQHAKGARGNTTSYYDRLLAGKVIGRCWEWIDENFDKLSKKEKQYIALELAKKTAPKEINVNATLTAARLLFELDADNPGTTEE